MNDKNKSEESSEKLASFIKDNYPKNPASSQDDFNNLMLKIEELESQKISVRHLVGHLTSFLQQNFVMVGSSFAVVLILFIMIQSDFKNNNGDFVNLSESDLIELLSVEDDMEGVNIAPSWFANEIW